MAGAQAPHRHIIYSSLRHNCRTRAHALRKVKRGRVVNGLIKELEQGGSRVPWGREI